MSFFLGRVSDGDTLFLLVTPVSSKQSAADCARLRAPAPASRNDEATADLLAGPVMIRLLEVVELDLLDMLPALSSSSLESRL